MNEKGVTLIALVISIIVMLILANVSINAILGENGIIAEAKDAKLMTEMAQVLFSIESDSVSVKMYNQGNKLNTLELIDALRKYVSNEYNYSMTYTKFGVKTMYFRIPDEYSIQNMKIALNGDVYLNNYKRAKIAISEIRNEFLKEGLRFGDSKIAIIDGNVRENSNNGMTILEQINGIDYSTLWINSNTEVFATANNVKFFPSGVTDYEILTFPIYKSSIAIEKNDQKYMLNTVSNIKYEKDLKAYAVETTAFHYIKDTDIILGPEEPKFLLKNGVITVEYEKPQAHVGGIAITRWRHCIRY